MKLESIGAQQTRLPKSLDKFFWDYPLSKLSWETDQDLIVRRILTNGSWEAITWLRKQMGDKMLRQWLLKHHGRGLSPRQIRFWELILDLPNRQIADWLRTAQAIPWGAR